MAKLKNVESLLVDQLKDLYSAEKQILKALPKMAKSASSRKLQNAFEEHLAQTEEHVNRLEQAFKLLGTAARSKKCLAIEGLIEEGKELMSKDAEPAVLDAGLIGAAQKVEHYEIASYGCARTWARQIGQQEAAALLQETLDEEAKPTRS